MEVPRRGVLIALRHRGRAVPHELRHPLQGPRVTRPRTHGQVRSAGVAEVVEAHRAGDPQGDPVARSREAPTLPGAPSEVVGGLPLEPSPVAWRSCPLSCPSSSRRSNQVFPQTARVRASGSGGSASTMARCITATVARRSPSRALPRSRSCSMRAPRGPPATPSAGLPARPRARPPQTSSGAPPRPASVASRGARRAPWRSSWAYGSWPWSRRAYGSCSHGRWRSHPPGVEAPSIGGCERATVARQSTGDRTATRAPASRRAPRGKATLRWLPGDDRPSSGVGSCDARRPGLRPRSRRLFKHHSHAASGRCPGGGSPTRCDSRCRGDDRSARGALCHGPDEGVPLRRRKDWRADVRRRWDVRSVRVLRGGLWRW